MICEQDLYARYRSDFLNARCLSINFSPGFFITVHRKCLLITTNSRPVELQTTATAETFVCFISTICRVFNQIEDEGREMHYVSAVFGHHDFKEDHVFTNNMTFLNKCIRKLEKIPNLNTTERDRERDSLSGDNKAILTVMFNTFSCDGNNFASPYHINKTLSLTPILSYNYCHLLF